MKRLFAILLLGFLLTGCGAKPTVEYVLDTLEEPVSAQAREIAVELPGEAAVPTMEDTNRRYYLCNDYELTVETMAGGDLSATVEALSGYNPEELTIVKTQESGLDRYEFVWATHADQGEQLGRAVILDDGNYHYTMSVLRDADTTETLQVVWRQVFSSFHLA